MERWLFLALSLSLFLWQNSSTAAVSLIPSRWKLRGCSTLIRPRDNRVLVFSLSSFSFSSFCVFFRPFSLVEGRRWGGAYRREARLYQVPFFFENSFDFIFFKLWCVCVCVHLHFYGRFNVEYPRSPQARTRLTEKGNAAIACFVFFSLPSLYRVFLLPNTLCEIRKWQPFQRFRLILVDFIGYFFSPRHQLATLFRPRKKATKQKKNQSGRRCPLP